MFSILLAAFGAVFAAEIAGDKLVYTAGILAARYRAAPIVWGVVAAFMVKMGVAVSVGHAIGSLPSALLVTVTTVSMAWVAWRLWRPTVVCRDDKAVLPSNTEAIAVSFTTVVCAEWADIGQITAATLAAQLGHPVIVWAGAVLAMTAKGAVAALVTARVARPLQRRLPAHAIRMASVTLIVAVGVWSVVETLSRP